MRAHPISEPVVDWPDVQIDRLDAAEGALHLAERFVAAYGCRVVQHVGRQAGAHYIYAIGGSFGGDLSGLAREAEAMVGDGKVEVLAHLVLLDHGTDSERDLRGPAQRLSLAHDGSLDAGEVAFGGRQQFLALAGALGSEIGIAADNQPLIGEVGAGDGGHVALVEQRELQGAALDQLLDRWGAQRGDPVEPGGLDIFGETRLGDHAAVADQHDVIEREPLLEFLDLGGERHRVAWLPSNT